jgi:uncharacterized protein YbjT (DUF2867 family)
MSKRTAVIVGSTGAIGRHLVPMAAAAQRYDKVVVLHHRRTPYGILAGVEERIVDFTRLPKPEPGEDIEAVFCCVGTTQMKAGSTGAFQAVDRDLPIALARWAAENNVTTFIGISSVGANSAAGSVYLKTKGQMEAGVAGAGLRSTYLFRPSVLEGERDEYRLAERVANRVLGVVGPLMVGPLRKYRPIHTKTVATAMLGCAAKATPGVHIVESDGIEAIGSGRVR